MNIGIIGAGLIGGKRAAALPPDMKLSSVADIDMKRAEELASTYYAKAMSTEELLTDKSISAVIIATTNNQLAPLTLQALKAGKHVLVEKPGATTVAELEEVEKLWKKSGLVVKYGYNHRHHPALQEARRIVDSGKMGELMFIRARYGHGGRIGYDKEWRADKKIAGGGELMDQGCHIIDLSRWFLGDFHYVLSHCHTFYWDMPVEDNAFAILRTKDGKVAQMHVSCTEWKNMFSLEIYGKTGKIMIDGLQGSYGAQRLTYYQMKPEMGPPDAHITEYPKEDVSWKRENAEWHESIVHKKEYMCTPSDALAIMKTVQQIYRGGKNDI